jgi:glycosyltransferase involved in cell wall biosynthesis
MRILHVIQSADPVSGGPIQAVKVLTEVTAAELAHEVVCLDAPGAPFLDRMPCPTHALGPGGMLGYASRLTPWLLANRDRYDAVFIHGLWRYASFGSWRGLRDGEVPYFVMPHGMLDPWFKTRYPLKHAKKWLFWPWTEYRMLRDARAVVFTCDTERERARESFWLYRCTEAVCMFGFPPPPGEAASQRAAFLTRHPDLAGKRIVLFFGRIHEKKGCDLLVRAFAQVAGADPRLQLVMAGPEQPSFGEHLRSEAARLGIGKRVTWTGMLDGDLKWGALRAGEVFVLPSHQENFGIAVTEALSCGLPVLISDQVQIWREIVDAGAGLAARDDLSGTAELLRRWLAMPEAARDAMRARALSSFAETFDARAWARRFADMLATHLPPAPGPALTPPRPAARGDGGSAAPGCRREPSRAADHGSPRHPARAPRPPRP